MTEKTFNCLACGIKIGSAGQHNKTCVLKCFDVYTDETLENIYKFIDRLKQKSYLEGYHRGMAEWVELTTTEKIEQQIKHDLEIVDQIIKLKQSWIEEGRRQALSELNELECPCCFVSLEVIEDGKKYKVHVKKKV